MAELLNLTQKCQIAARVVEARSFYARLRGLLGQSQWPSEQALWIPHCNSIHTFFMKFPIDLVFVSKKMEVRALIQNVDPWRLVPPVWGASSVFEFAAGALATKRLQVGDVLNVRP